VLDLRRAGAARRRGIQDRAQRRGRVVHRHRSLPAAAAAGGMNDDAAAAAMKKDKKNLLVGVWASLATSRPGFPPTGAAAASETAAGAC
jgi:hypothetical protein